MAHTRQVVDNIPLAAAYTPIYPLDKSNFHFSGTIHSDDTWTGDRPIAIYFHGSGAAGHVPIDDPLAVAVVERGVHFIAIRDFGSGTSSGRPSANGYGNVNSPMFYANQIKNAWRVQAGIEFVRSVKPTGDIILLGHSNGAAAAFAWSSICGTPGFSPASAVSCVVGNGVTQGGLGDMRWNNVMRNMSVISQLFHRCKHPAIAFYADLDGFCPPDFARRMQASLPTNSPVNVISPGAFPHGWFPLQPDFAVNLMMNLYRNEPLLVNGIPVIPGAG